MNNLQTELLRAQADLLREAKRPVVVLLAGFAGAGKSDVAARLSEWMDPRRIRTLAFDGSAALPVMAEAWRTLPPKGQISVVHWGWYARMFYGTAKDARRDAERALQFERALIKEGAVIVKIWLDLSEKGQQKRLSAFEADKRTRWRATKADWREHKNYRKYAMARDELFATTSATDTAWYVIDAEDEAARDEQVARALLQSLGEKPPAEPKAATKVRKAAATSGGVPVLAKVDRNVRLGKDKAEDKIPALQGRLSKLVRDPAFAKRSLVLVFEGSDAAGKGGAIKRITAALDARQYRAVPIAAPTEEERRYHYLWRFWRDVPALGRVSIFDRSWYGRVLVERVEGFASAPAWQRAYTEINDFEEQLSEHGVIVVKFWLAVTKAEQLARFKERQNDPTKRYKITEEDFRNRSKWDAYEEAAQDAFAHTHTKHAPWTVIGANDKDHARVTVLETLVKRLKREL
jgi:AMP-polyphosphate phosphotransferase